MGTPPNGVKQINRYEHGLEVAEQPVIFRMWANPIPM